MELSLVVAVTIDSVICNESNKLVESNINKEYIRRIVQYTPDFSRNLIIIESQLWDYLPYTVDTTLMYLVLTHEENTTSNDQCRSVNSFREALEYACANKHMFYKCFVMGGFDIYQQAMESGFVTEIFMTSYDFSTLDMKLEETSMVKFLPDLSGYSMSDVKKIQEIVHLCTGEKITTTVSITHGKRLAPFEIQYQDLLSDILKNGIRKSTRGTDTLSLSDRTIKINLQDGFPISTLRKTFFRGIVEELLWIMRGETDVKILQKNNIHVWDGNSNREYLDRIGLTNLAEWDIGPGYGFQMRHAGAEYINCNTNYTGKGVDQLIKCVEMLQHNADSRRIIINLWNPVNVDSMALPPCHSLYQFTTNNGILNCHLYQRSWDVLLGWNTSTAALLTHILADYCKMRVGILTHTIGDAHVYTKNIEHCRKLLRRCPYKLPKLEIIGETQKIDSYTYNNFKLHNYKSHEKMSIELITGNK